MSGDGWSARMAAIRGRRFGNRGAKTNRGPFSDCRGVVSAGAPNALSGVRSRMIPTRGSRSFGQARPPSRWNPSAGARNPSRPSPDPDTPPPPGSNALNATGRSGPRLHVPKMEPARSPLGSVAVSLGHLRLQVVCGALSWIPGLRGPSVNSGVHTIVRRALCGACPDANDTIPLQRKAAWPSPPEGGV